MKRFKVYVNCNVMGTINVDAESANGAQDMVEDMDSVYVLADMSKGDIEIIADDAEEIDEEN